MPADAPSATPADMPARDDSSRAGASAAEPKSKAQSVPKHSASVIPSTLVSPHFMSSAPLDVWMRALRDANFRIAPKYIPRLILSLIYSGFTTAITLPERLLLAPLLRLRMGGQEPVVKPKGGVVVILGYYRSGTTHLHYLLSCDRRMYAPRWHQAVLPHAFALTWTLMRIVLVPFMPNTRGQDDMSIGADWPAEDDFATNNWALASSLPGRYVFPEQRKFFARFHSLSGLTKSELGRWRRVQAWFVWKLGVMAGRRTILLKTPSHTARVAELRRLFGEDVKFIHISRKPAAVVRSNVAMHSRLEAYHLQEVADDEATREYVVGEYLDTERRFLDESKDLPKNRLVNIRYEDLVADPVGCVDNIYNQLELEPDERFKPELVRYLHEVADYRAASAKAKAGDTGALGVEERHDERLDDLTHTFGHDQPAPAKVPLPPSPPLPEGSMTVAMLACVATAVACGLAWAGILMLADELLDPLIWAWGALIGYFCIRVARRGSLKLGLFAAGLTLVFYALAVYPITWIAYAEHDHWTNPPLDTWKAIQNSVIALNMNTIMLTLGVFTAFRYATRVQFQPPGR